MRRSQLDIVYVLIFLAFAVSGITTIKAYAVLWFGLAFSSLLESANPLALLIVITAATVFVASVLASLLLALLFTSQVGLLLYLLALPQSLRGNTSSVISPPLIRLFHRCLSILS